MRTLALIALMLALAAATGCGRKGPLYLPAPAEEEAQTE